MLASHFDAKAQGDVNGKTDIVILADLDRESDFAESKKGERLQKQIDSDERKHEIILCRCMYLDKPRPPTHRHLSLTLALTRRPSPRTVEDFIECSGLKRDIENECCLAEWDKNPAKGKGMCPKTDPAPQPYHHLPLTGMYRDPRPNP